MSLSSLQHQAAEQPKALCGFGTTAKAMRVAAHVLVRRQIAGTLMWVQKYIMWVQNLTACLGIGLHGRCLKGSDPVADAPLSVP